MKNFLQEIKERKIRKWLSIYISTSITIIGVDRLLSLRYDWPNFVFDVVLFTLLFGLISTIITAWFHGKEGIQKFKKKEIVLHSIIIAVWLTVLVTQIDYGRIEKENINKKIVAVLPFANFNETKETEFIADGITDDILNQLSKISDLKVISRTSVMKYKNSDKNISDISKELGAGTILEGSVRTSENKIRIVGQLIDSNTDTHIWSGTYDRELKDIFEIQSDIAERIAASLHAKLLPLEKKHIQNKSTENPDAYTFYLKGKDHYYNYTENENEKAIEFYRKALNVDSTYALALSGLADAYGQKVTKYWASEEWMDSALVLSKKAIKLNLELPEAYKSLASVYHYREEADLASANYEKAIKLNPSYWTALLNYGQLKMTTGHFDDALYWIRRANELAPDDVMGTISVSMIYKALNCDSSAIEWAEKALELDPQNIYPNYFLGDLFLNYGDIKNAEKYFNQIVKLDSTWVLGWFLGGRLESIKNDNKTARSYFDKYMNITNSAPEYYYAYCLQKLNFTDSAKIILDEEANDYSEYFKDKTPLNIFDYTAFAEIYALRGQIDSSFYWWQKAINHGYTDVSHIEVYPYLNNLKNDERYNVLITQMRTKIDSFKTETKSKYPFYYSCK